jgi:hypothetical protein
MPQPSSWQLWFGGVEPDDHTTMPGSYLWLWHPAELNEIAIDPNTHTTGSLDLALGYYVFKLRLEWGRIVGDPDALGWVEYGWAVKIISGVRTNDRSFAPQ